MDRPNPDTPDRRLWGAYEGDAGGLAPLAVATAMLTLVTLGLYRFWERTRIRRYIWSSIAPGGDPFEYTGTGLEKLLGFLVAFIILAVGLGLLQFGLTFLGLSVFDTSAPDTLDPTAILITSATPILLIPLIFYAQYRARRYRLSRTTWRGIRFGVRPGAWGYAGRAMLLWAVTLLSLGLLWPLMTFTLEKYQTDRTFFGTAAFEQGGRWTMLFPAMGHLAFAIQLILAGILLLNFAGAGLLLLLAGGLWLPFGIVAYRVRAYRILLEHRRLGDVRFGTDLAPGAVFGRILKGLLAVLLLSALLGSVFTGLLAASGLTEVGTAMREGGTLPQPTALQSVGSIAAGLVSLQLFGVLVLLFVRQPVLAMVVRRSWVVDPLPLTAVAQRRQDDFADADGFADALDVGGGF